MAAWRRIFPSACSVLVLSCASAFAAGDAAPKVEHYDWQGELGGNIPVAVRFETRDGLIVGEIVYTGTQERTPIRLLGTVVQGQMRMKEMRQGLIAGSITGAIANGVFEGVRRSPGEVIKKDEAFEFVDGKELPLRLVAVPGQSGPFRWECDPAALAGKYVYSYGNYAAEGVADIAGIRDGVVEFSIGAHIGAPSYNMAVVPADEPGEKGRNAQGRMQGNRVVHEESEDCAFEILFFYDFLFIRNLEGKTCDGWFGRGAGVEGHFVRVDK